MIWRASITSCAAALACACGGDAGERAAPGDAGPLYPGADWAVADPGTRGFDAAALAAAVTWAGEHDSNCLVVAQGGAIVAEQYWAGWDASSTGRVFSITKTITSLLVGIAVDRGELGLDERASRYVTEWLGSDSEGVSVGDLLTMASGRHWDFQSDYVQLALNQDDKTSFAVSLGQDHPPGTFWEYNNAAVQSLARVLERATGSDVTAYAEQHLFAPIGSAGHLTPDASGHAILFSDSEHSCRDLARVALLLARGGTWRDQTVVSRAWVDAMHVASTPLNAAYGRLMWLNQAGHYVLPSAPSRKEGDGQIAPGAPAELFAALGFGGQIAAVDPTSDVIVARIGPATLTDDPIGLELVTGLLPQITSAAASARP